MKLGKIFIENVSSFDIRGKPILKLLPQQEGFLMNYSWYFKNMRAQEKLMKECGAEYFAVSHI